jgi:23S rRNA (guanosine2251-2'-O)-methyltransferase
MDISPFQIFQCDSSSCSLRYPVIEGQGLVDFCPRCGSRVHLVALRERKGDRVPHPTFPVGPPLEALLDNIRSAWNVGSIFRTANGLGIHRLHLCGITATPQNPKVTKTALGAEKVVDWDYFPDGTAAAAALVQKGLRLWALEHTLHSLPLSAAVAGLPGAPLVLIVGNETCGVDPGILQYCEQVVSIPMQGVKRSLNAAVAFGIAAHFLRYFQIGENA